MNAKRSDVNPEEVLKGKSQAYYEHMKDLGTRIISRNELHKVTPNAPGKSRFVLVDCVGVTETDKSETPNGCKTGILENFNLQPVFIKQSSNEELHDKRKPNRTSLNR